MSSPTRRKFLLGAAAHEPEYWTIQSYLEGEESKRQQAAYKRRMEDQAARMTGFELWSGPLLLALGLVSVALMLWDTYR